MRGALGRIDGVREVRVAPGNREVAVAYDPRKVTVADLLGALAAAGQPAKAAQ